MASTHRQNEMNLHYRLKRSVTLSSVLAALILVVGSCSGGSQAFKRGQRAEVRQNYEAAMAEYKAALDLTPDNLEYRLKYEQARFAAAFDHFEQGRRAVDKGEYDTAKREFTRTLEIDPTHVLAEQQLAKVNEILESRAQKRPEPEIELERLKDATRTDPSVASQLQPRVRGPIDIHITQDSRAAFETISQLAGLNIIFDPDFRGQRIPIDLTNVDIYQALDILALQTRSFWKPVNQTTILVSPDNQTKRRDYDELVLKTIYLSNSVTATEITEAITALRTLLNMRYLAQSTSMNAIIVRDTADRIAIAEKIIQDIDKAKPEVIVDVTVLEVDRSLIRDLGILPPAGTNLTFRTPGTSGTTATNTITLDNPEAVSAENFTVNIPEAVARFVATNNKTKLVQNPRVRATDGKLASIRIGQRVPVASGSFQPAFVGATGTPVVQFQYVDVGVNLDMTPRVLLNREVSMTVLVQVQALAGDRNIGGVTQPVFTNRSIQHEIRLAEGETNILGGIITDTDSVSMTGIPGLKDIPLIKYFFAQEKKTREETEIIIMLTPHIVRMPNVLEANMRGLYTGSETIPRLRVSPEVAAIGATTPVTARPGIPPAVSPIPNAPGNTPPPATPPVVTTVPPPATNAQPTNAALGFAPTPIRLSPSGPTTVSVTVEGNDISGTDITFAYDPDMFRIREMREGGYLSRDGQAVAIVERVDTASGTATISLDRPAGAPSLSGTGSLVTLVLEPSMRSGEAVLRVTNFQVRNAQQVVQPGRVAEVRVNVP
jgi:general secretion pathway protein D